MMKSLGIPSLTYKQRLIGFGICWAIGLLLGSLGTLAMGDLRTFAILLTFSNICNLTGTFFLVGPVTQAKSMFEPVRIIASCVYLAALGVTLFAAIALKSALLSGLMCMVQSIALFWYLLSYIPYARTICLRCLRGAVEQV